MKKLYTLLIASLLGITAIAQSQVAYYPFSGNATDQSGNGNNGTVNGATLTADRFGNSSNAYSFSGSASYIDVTGTSSINPSLMSDFSESCWIYVANTTTADKRITWHGPQTCGYDLIFRGASNKIVLANDGCGSIAITSSGTISTGTWYHIVYTMDYSSNTTTLYINGVACGSSSTAISKPNSTLLTIGTQPNHDNTVNFDGKIDDIGIYNSVLTQNQIDSLYNVTPQTNCLVANYPFTGNANDQSGNGNNGTVNGATLTADRFGNSGSAYTFSGSASYIDVTGTSSINPSLMSNFSESCWIYVANTTTADKRITWHGPQTCGYDLLFRGTSNKIVLANDGCGSIAITSSGNISTGTWYHIVYTMDYSSNTTTLYINGVANGSSSTAISKPNSTLLTIGTQPNHDNTVNFDGKIDDIVVYGCVLTQTQIDSLYNVGSSSNCMVTYYPFSGNANDQSGNGNNGTVSGATLTTDRFGSSNNAYSFAGSASYIDVTGTSSINPSLMSDFSESCWIYVANTTTADKRITWHGPQTCGYDLIFRGASNKIVLANDGCGSIAITSSGTISTGTWYHIVYTMDYSSNTTTLYINGVACGSSSTAISKPNSTLLTIGTQPNHDNTVNFDGKIDDIVVYGCVLTQTQIDSLYNSTTTSVNNNLTPEEFSINPNPANESITIDFAAYSDKNTLAEIYDINGKLLQRLSIQQKKTEVNISGLPSGIYIVKVTGDSGVAVKRMIKE